MSQVLIFHSLSSLLRFVFVVNMCLALLWFPVIVDTLPGLFPNSEHASTSVQLVRRTLPELNRERTQFQNKKGPCHTTELCSSRLSTAGPVRRFRPPHLCSSLSADLQPELAAGVNLNRGASCVDSLISLHTPRHPLWNLGGPCRPGLHYS